MKKYAKILNENTKEVQVGLGSNTAFYISCGMTEMDVEESQNGCWYLINYKPVAPQKSYIEKRQAEYPSLSDQLDMIYWDKVNSTNLWQDKITEIKSKYPKE